MSGSARAGWGGWLQLKRGGEGKALVLPVHADRFFPAGAIGFARARKRGRLLIREEAPGSSAIAPSPPGGMSTCDVKEYLARKEIPQLFEVKALLAR